MKLFGHLDSERRLVDELRKGNGKAFETIFFRYHPRISYFADRFIREFDAAGDLATDVLMQLWVRKEDFDNLKAIKSFLYNCAENACVDHFRRSKVALEYQQRAFVEMTNDQLHEIALSHMYEAENMKAITEAIDTLPRQCKRVVRLTLKGLNTDDIAAMMNLSPQTVRNTRVRATGLLKRRLGPESLLSLAIMSALQYFGRR